MPFPTRNKKTKESEITPELIEQVRDMCGKYTAIEIGKALGRSAGSITKICTLQGFSLRLLKKKQAK